MDSDPTKITCAFTVSNDSIKTTFLPNARKKKVIKEIPRAKQMNSYPAVLIGRLGVALDFKRKGVGKELMIFIMAWFIESNNKTGCRYVVVDAYNEDEPLRYYTQCGFTFLFSTEKQEKEYLDLEPEDKLTTRLMYFDLILLATS